MLKWKRHNKSFRSFTQTSIDEENRSSIKTQNEKIIGENLL